MTKALGLLSNGLDSLLACLLLRQAKINIEAISYSSLFFKTKQARQIAKYYDIPLTILKIDLEHLNLVVKQPRYGYGSNMNPCIDCHAYMLAKAGVIMNQRGFDFLFTGEILGQRPMSQNRQALNIVAKASGFNKQILRPLSAKLLPPTTMEKLGLVNRNLLLSFFGRGRKPQINLAKKLGIKKYPTSTTSGCLLTDPNFSQRLSDLFHHTPKAGKTEIKILKYGRHLRLTPRSKIIIGRNNTENTILQNLTIFHNSYQLTVINSKGPLGIYLGPLEQPDILIAAAIIASYNQIPPQKLIKVQIKGKELLSIVSMNRQEIKKFLL